MASLVGKTDNTGWLCSPVGVFAQNSSSLSGGIRISSTAASSSWIETPELDLLQPVVLQFESKKWTKEGEGSLYCVINADTIMYVSNTNNTITPRKSVTFLADKKSRIRFTGINVDANDICIDSIRVAYTDEPTLSLPLVKVVDMGKVKPMERLNYTLPISMKNSSGTLSFILSDNDKFSFNGESILEFNDEVSTNELNFVFDAPEQSGKYMARVTMNGDDNFDPRVIWLLANVDAASDFKSRLEDHLKIAIQQQNIKVLCNENLELKLFSITGQLLVSSRVDNSVCELQAPHKGVFIIRIKNDSGFLAQKIIIN